MMYVGTPPFSTTNDAYYKFIKDKKYEIFWKAHSRRKPTNFFSPEFKNLIEKMVASDPNERASVK